MKRAVIVLACLLGMWGCPIPGSESKEPFCWFSRNPFTGTCYKVCEGGAANSMEVPCP